MCLIKFAYKVDSRFDLVIAANRDEFYKRGTAQADFWEEAPQVLAGRDLEKMGTWMGVTKQGRFAALTNYRDHNGSRDYERSRGELVSEFLKDNCSPESYLEIIKRDSSQYPGFNLLVGDKNTLYYYSNIENELYLLQPGIYGLSNHLLNTNWPKVQKGKKGLEECLKNKGDLKDCLFRVLFNAEQAKDDELPQTGVTLEWKKKLSPLFISAENYGTRSSTVLCMNREKVEFIERTFTGEAYNEREFEFSIEKV
ncbi:uncharacterized protein with NRDE domain [Metabacillus crassostreae]|uniref:NRDE family protein n=1 Tax=Metabacillus crassostreae TaxID=929098 RepID=UPI001957B0AD|nr:NRDE family protein [Metabacillus crassostreae]MBM7602350.1 uncharacterized protein with NRDE domain [Metabacillus crassostreae]